MEQQAAGPEYVVVGNPVSHSRSPVIHQLFAEQTAQQLSYGRLLAPLDGFEATVERFLADGGLGLNVTVPFKEAAARWVGELDSAAQAAAAVNTIVVDRRDGRQRSCKGYNTDGDGLIIDLTRQLRGGLAGARVLLLGAGGAARGIVQPLLRAQPERLVVANRGVEKARALVAQLDIGEGSHIQACGLDSISGSFDLVINATSAGLTGAVPAVAETLVKNAYCYDLLYGAAATSFCRWARAAGAAEVMDGLGMLVEQAALAFELWRGVKPDTEPVLAELRRGLVK